MPKVKKPNSTVPIVSLLLSLAGPEVKRIADLFESKRNGDECFDVYPWTGDFWYLTIRSETKGPYPEDNLVGVTVDIQKDQVFWSAPNPAYPNFTYGGNCFTRSDKWTRILRELYPGIAMVRGRMNGQEGTLAVHDYRARRTDRGPAHV